MSLKKVKIINLERIYNKKGDILKIINKKNKNFKKFGEIYFSEIKKKNIKGWNLHKKFYCHITVCYGDLILRLKDKKLKLKKLHLSSKKPKLVIIPPKNMVFISSKRKELYDIKYFKWHS